MSGESLGLSFGYAGMSPAMCITVLALAVMTPLSRQYTIHRVSANSLADYRFASLAEASATLVSL